MDAPFLDDHLRFFETVEDLTVETFISELAIEGFTVSILPWRSWLIVGTDVC